MKLVMSSQAIAVVGLPPGEPDPQWARGAPLVSITRTQNETSVICPTSSVPEDVQGPVQGPLVGVYVDEQLDFSQAGILVALLRPLADAGIPVLTVSTYATDWVLLEASNAAAAASVWRAAGYQVHDAAARSQESAADDSPVSSVAAGSAQDPVIDVRDPVEVSGSVEGETA